MKITNVETIVVNMPMKLDDAVPMQAGQARTSIDMLLVRIDTDGGISGWGEGFGHRIWLCTAKHHQGRWRHRDAQGDGVGQCMWCARRAALGVFRTGAHGLDALHRSDAEGVIGGVLRLRLCDQPVARGHPAVLGAHGGTAGTRARRRAGCQGDRAIANRLRRVLVHESPSET